MKNAKPGKPDPTEPVSASRQPARPRAGAPVPGPTRRAPSAPGRVLPEDWRGKKRNMAINDTIVAKFKVLNARGRSLTQIADRLGISVGRARNIAAEIRLGKR